MFGQLLLQAGADGVVRQYLPGVDLGEALLDFADEPVVVVDGSLDGFADQQLGRHAPAASRPRQLALEVGREVHFHRASVLSGHGVSTAGPSSFATCLSVPAQALAIDMFSQACAARGASQTIPAIDQRWTMAGGNRHFCAAIAQLSDRVSLRAVPTRPLADAGQNDLGVSLPGTLVAYALTHESGGGSPVISECNASITLNLEPEP